MTIRKSLFSQDTASLDPSVRAFRALLLVSHRLKTLMDVQLRPDGLTTMQAAALTAVIALGSPSLTELAEALGTTRQNTAQLIGPLERKGLIRIDLDPTDGRRKRMVATDHSTTYWAQRDDSDLAAVRSWFSPLTATELDTLNALVRRVLDGVEQNAPDVASAPDQSP